MKDLAREIIAGRRLRRGEDFSFFLGADPDELRAGAHMIRMAFFGRTASLCTIINGRSGGCGENCKFCAQSAEHQTGISEYEFIDPDLILEDCRRNERDGVGRYSIVTSGRTLEGKDFDKALESYRRMSSECSIGLCASHGLLNEDQLIQLREAGVSMYHSNIETSERHFPNICTTHSYRDKIIEIYLAKKAGLKVCSGGIIGMGESWEDRIDMAVSLSELKVDSIPINVLTPVKGTCFSNMHPLTEDDILNTIAIFRYINPEAHIRMAAGRNRFNNGGARIFLAGADGAITGDLLTTTGSNTEQDKLLLAGLGFQI